MSDRTEITAATRRLPGPLVSVVENWYARFAERHGQAPIPADFVEPVVRAVAASEFAAATLLADWPWLRERLASLAQPFDEAGLAAFADEFTKPDLSIDEAKRRLRERRRRELFAIFWRDLQGLATIDASIEALSSVADELLRAAADHAAARLAERFGRVRDRAGNPVDLVIIAMGKLGGRELNFSSDIDLIFAYPSRGASDGARSLDAQPYFDRLSRDIVALMDERTADGIVFRTDTRLRPFGDSGPPVVSFSALESYLAKHGRDWERYAYVKASIVGPRPPEPVCRGLFDDLIRPFVYRRYLDYGVFESLREMHARSRAAIAPTTSSSDRAASARSNFSCSRCRSCAVAAPPSSRIRRCSRSCRGSSRPAVSMPAWPASSWRRTAG